MASPRRIVKARVPMTRRVCDDCECPFLADVGSAETSCLRCFVRTDTSIFFVECEDCDVVIVSPTDEQAASGKDEDGEWRCVKCRVPLYEVKCGWCNSRGVEIKNADGWWVHYSCENPE